MSVYAISGFFNDDLTDFDDYLVTDSDDTPAGYSDEQIFHYGISKPVEHYIDDDGLDFTILTYRIVEE